MDNFQKFLLENPDFDEIIQEMLILMNDSPIESPEIFTDLKENPSNDEYEGFLNEINDYKNEIENFKTSLLEEENLKENLKIDEISDSEVFEELFDQLAKENNGIQTKYQIGRTSIISSLDYNSDLTKMIKLKNLNDYLKSETNIIDLLKKTIGIIGNEKNDDPNIIKFADLKAESYFENHLLLLRKEQLQKTLEFIHKEYEIGNGLELNNANKMVARKIGSENITSLLEENIQEIKNIIYFDIRKEFKKNNEIFLPEIQEIDELLQRQNNRENMIELIVNKEGERILEDTNDFEKINFDLKQFFENINWLIEILSKNEKILHNIKTFPIENEIFLKWISKCNEYIGKPIKNNNNSGIVFTNELLQILNDLIEKNKKNKLQFTNSKLNWNYSLLVNLNQLKNLIDLINKSTQIRIIANKAYSVKNIDIYEKLSQLSKKTDETFQLSNDNILDLEKAIELKELDINTETEKKKLFFFE